MNGDPYSYFIHFMSDELQQNGSQVDRSAFDPMSSSISGITLGNEMSALILKEP